MLAAFMNSAPSILTEAQNYKLFGKTGVLPWALAVWPHGPATGWDLELSWPSAHLQGDGLPGILPVDSNARIPGLL